MKLKKNIYTTAIKADIFFSMSSYYHKLESHQCTLCFSKQLQALTCLQLAINCSTTIQMNFIKGKLSPVKQCQHLYPNLLSPCLSKSVHRFYLTDFSLASATVHCSSPSNRTHSDICWVKFRLVIASAPQK